MTEEPAPMHRNRPTSTVRFGLTPRGSQSMGDFSFLPTPTPALFTVSSCASSKHHLAGLTQRVAFTHRLLSLGDVH